MDMFDSVRKENPKSFFSYNDLNLLEGSRLRRNAGKDSHYIHTYIHTYVYTYIRRYKESANNEKIT